MFFFLEILLIFALVITLILINIYISIKLIRAVNEVCKINIKLNLNIKFFHSFQQKYKLFRPFLAVGLFSTIFLIIEIIKSLNLIILILTIIYAYNWIVVYSLYENYKTESKISKHRISTIESTQI